MYYVNCLLRLNLFLSKQICDRSVARLFGIYLFINMKNQLKNKWALQVKLTFNIFQCIELKNPTQLLISRSEL